MQSVVTGQVPIALERKITSGGKRIKRGPGTWYLVYSAPKPLPLHVRCVRRTYIIVYTYWTKTLVENERRSGQNEPFIVLLFHSMERTFRVVVVVVVVVVAARSRLPVFATTAHDGIFHWYYFTCQGAVLVTTAAAVPKQTNVNVRFSTSNFRSDLYAPNYRIPRNYLIVEFFKHVQFFVQRVKKLSCLEFVCATHLIRIYPYAPRAYSYQY